MLQARLTRRTLLGAVALAAATGGQGLKVAAEDTITIGSFVATTGTGAPFGLDQLQAIKLAIKHINEAGGIQGHKLLLQYRDTAYEKTQAQSVMHEFVADQTVIGVLGPTSSAEAFAADPLAVAAGLPVLAPANGAKGIPQIGAYVHRINVPEERLLPAVARSAVKLLGLKKVTVLFAQDDPFALTGAKAFQEELKSEGVDILESVAYDAARTVDFAALLQRVAASKPEAIFVAAKSSDAALLLRQARQSGLDQPIIGNTSFTSPSLLAAAGDAVEGLIVGSVWDPSDPSEMNQRFVKDYKAAYNRDATSLAAGAYNTVYVLKQALDTSKEFTREGLQKGMLALKNYHYLGSEVKFVDLGNSLRDAELTTPYLFQYKNGKLIKLSSS